MSETTSTPPLIDTHAHLCDDCFDSDREAVLERARRSGVAAVIAVGETLADAHRNLELARHYPMLKPALGLYPAYAEDTASANAIETLIRENRERISSIGEVGLDYQIAREEKERAAQHILLKRSAHLAMELDLPLNVHSRAAGRQTIELLLDTGIKRVQMHAYHGPHKPAKRAVKAGWFFSVPASVVRSNQIQELVSALPLDSLLLESDSPVLSPVAGERNEPATIANAIETIARLKSVTTEEAMVILLENTTRLYGDSLLSPTA
ncbi:MAG: TatD family hydrolase [Magnetococcales bacterium]|nr:TatD family hydrolase [Magnetococcales bacterium]